MSWKEKYINAGPITQFQTQCTPIPHTTFRINVIKTNKFHAIKNICPHQGASLHTGQVVDIEEMGIFFALICEKHGWAFDLETGACENSRFVVDVFDTRIDNEELWVSIEPKNLDVVGPRRDFGGREL